jgi:histone H3/H4
MYDIEQFLKEAGAEKINEKAVISLERELQDTVNELVYEASIYANYAGRRKVIKVSDIELAKRSKGTKGGIRYARRTINSKRQNSQGRSRIEAPKLMLINNVPVVEAEQNI